MQEDTEQTERFNQMKDWKSELKSNDPDQDQDHLVSDDNDELIDKFNVT